MSDDTAKMRWDPYIPATGQDFDAFWDRHLNRRRRDILFIVGRGFDVLGIERFFNLGGEGSRDAWLLGFDDGMPNSDYHVNLTEKNSRDYHRIFDQGVIQDLSIRLVSADNKVCTSRSTHSVIGKHKDKLKAYDDIVIDINAIPRMVAMTVIVKVLFLLDEVFEKEEKDINLHVLIAESVRSDREAMQDSLRDTISSVVGFSGRLTSEIREHIPRVWFPILGEGQELRLERIFEALRPDEICPVIPFPSKNVRRGDEIIAEYRKILFDVFQIEPKNILHASEFNPFEAYKRIYTAIDHYRNSLDALGGCGVYISPLSSKLLSVGAVLACYNHRANKDEKLVVGIPFIEAMNYDEPTQSAEDNAELYSMWIRGEWER